MKLSFCYLSQLSLLLLVPVRRISHSRRRCLSCGVKVELCTTSFLLVDKVRFPSRCYRAFSSSSRKYFRSIIRVDVRFPSRRDSSTLAGCEAMGEIFLGVSSLPAPSSPLISMNLSAERSKAVFKPIWTGQGTANYSSDDKTFSCVQQICWNSRPRKSSC